MPTYIVTYDNGDESIIDMADRVTLADATKYFLGKTFSYEDAAGAESYQKAVKVESYEEYEKRILADFQIQASGSLLI